MARLIGPDEGSRKAEAIVNDVFRAKRNKPATVYTDAQVTQLADILTTGGAPIAGSALTTDAYSMLPLFQFPDGVDTLWVVVDGGPPWPIYARNDDRLDALGTRLADAETVAGAAETPSGAQAKASAAQAAAATDAGSKVTAHVAATDPHGDRAYADAGLDALGGRVGTVEGVAAAAETPAGAQAKASAAQAVAVAASAQRAANLADLTDVAAARGNLGAPRAFPVPAPTGVAATDTAAILAAVNAATAAGGGTIQFQPGRYRLNQTVPVREALSYVGVPPTLTPRNPGAGYMPDAEWDYDGGTVFVGDGTFPGFSANTTPAASAVDGVFGPSQISSVHIYGFALETFSNGIQIGATNVMGIVWSSINEVCASKCTEWGIKLINFQHLDIGVVRTCDNAQGGQYYAAEVPWPTLIPGNSHARELFDKARTDTNTRGIRIGGFNTTTPQLGGFDVGKLQVNAFNKPLISQTATFVSGSADVAVTDGTKFGVGMPVQFTTTAGGFAANNIYVVKTVAGNTLTLANSTRGAAITASASGTATIRTAGYANVEVIGVGASLFHDLDLEGTGSVSLYAEDVEYSTFTHKATMASLVQLVARNAARCTWYAPFAAVTDFDAATASQAYFYGARTNNYGRPLAGLHYDAVAGTQVLGIGMGQQGASGGDLQIRRNGFVYPATGMGERIFTRDTAISLTGLHAGTIVCTSGLPVTFTLPAIITDTAPVSNSHLGLIYDICNVGAGTLTVATDGTQVLNKVAGRTSVTVAPGNSLKVIAAKDNGGNLFWLAKASPLVA